MANPELPEDAREVPFDGAIREEEGGGDLAVRLALGDEGGDPLLGRRERAGRRGAPADPLELRPRPFRPERRADPVEDGQRLLEGGARFTPVLQATLRRTEREERAPAVERQLDPRVQVERILESAQRRLQLSGLSVEQPSTAQAVGERRDALEPLRVSLVPVEELDRLVSTTELDESLDVVD